MSTLTRNGACATPAARPMGLFATLNAMMVTRRQRQQLRSLSDERIRDLGLSRAEIEAESSRPLWDVPANWRR